MPDRFRNVVPLAAAHSDAKRVLETLRQRIVEHALAPGAPLREQELAAEFGVSRARIRRLVLLPGRAEEGMRQHREILAAMRVGDADTAETLKRENIRSARQWFHDYQKYLL